MVAKSGMFPESLYIDNKYFFISAKDEPLELLVLIVLLIAVPILAGGFEFADILFEILVDLALIQKYRGQF